MPLPCLAIGAKRPSPGMRCASLEVANVAVHG